MIDQNGGIEEEQHLADPVLFGSPLLSHPSRGIFVPFVRATYRSRSGANEFAAPAFLKRASYRGADESGAAAVTGVVVDLSDQFIVQFYVYSHTHKIAHSSGVRRSLTPGDCLAM